MPDGTPSPRHGYDSYNGQDCDMDYIVDLVKPKTDAVYYAKEPTVDGQGCGIIFINRNHDEIKKIIDCDNLIVEHLGYSYLIQKSKTPQSIKILFRASPNMTGKGLSYIMRPIHQKI